MPEAVVGEEYGRLSRVWCGEVRGDRLRLALGADRSGTIERLIGAEPTRGSWGSKNGMGPPARDVPFWLVTDNGALRYWGRVIQRRCVVAWGARRNKTDGMMGAAAKLLAKATVACCAGFVDQELEKMTAKACM